MNSTPSARSMSAIASLPQAAFDACGVSAGRSTALTTVWVMETSLRGDGARRIEQNCASGEGRHLRSRLQPPDVRETGVGLERLFPRCAGLDSLDDRTFDGRELLGQGDD